MPDRRFSSRRRELQQQMKKASSRVMRNGKELERALEAWTKAAHEDCLLAFLAQLADCYGRLVQRTPVDTGRARAGWHIEGSLDEWKPKPGEYEEARGQAEKLIAREVTKLQDLSKADVVYIMNNIEYILPLEAGYSRQSSGFWALFMKELSSQLEQAAQRSRKGTA